MNLYVSKNGQKLGPYSIEQIQIFLRQGLITLDDQVWAEGWNTWRTIRSVPELSQEGRPAPTIPVVPVTITAQKSELQYAQGKEPVVACFLSLFIVGTGQFYNGDWAKGWFLLGTCVVASYFSCGTLWLGYALFSAVDAYRVAARLKPLNSWNWFA